MTDWEWKRFNVSFGRAVHCLIMAREYDGVVGVGYRKEAVARLNLMKHLAGWTP